MIVDRADSNHLVSEEGASFASSTLLRLAGVTFVALAVANCSKVGGIDPKYGVAASPRVVRDGEPVPKGGGRQLVGKPYTVAGKTYVPGENQSYSREGLASWYGVNFHGRLTANGEVFDRASIAAAHPTMPLPSYARITNVSNGHSMIVRVNDRGPYHGNRIVDVSERAADALGFKRSGTARVRVEYVGRASVNGSDDRVLLASLRTDGQPASLTGGAPTMIAAATPRPTPVRETIATQTYEASEEVAVVETPAPVMPQAQPLRPTTIGMIPLPPERPFDLGTIPGAATPVPMVVSSAGSNVLPPSRPIVAGLYYAEPQSAPQKFERSATFGTLDQTKFAVR
ncbi:septal ring lytic transglycosylase RlpA family protein [Microvirga flavescens]|uniref:septal ring lytic transglycosylase RlpA family protein n=1 Tax=Microvirga flavescens TaxID=2249811 RepID=UPI000DD9F15F|nr:septal ring lytic transglycosylase RlpA family protein [Microvirga flavescens]